MSAGFSELFENPYPTASATSQGQSGGAIASLAENCKEMKNALMPFSYLFTLQQQYGFHSHLLAIDAAKSAAGSPPTFAPWFSLAVPGTSTTQDDPIIMKLCNVLIEFDNNGILKGSLAAGSFLNDMTGGQFDNELTLSDTLYNASNSLFDLQNGTVRVGALRSAYVHKQLIDAGSASKKYWEQKSGNKNPEGLETESRRRQKIDRIAQLSYQRTILKESTECPTPPSNTNYQEKYIKEILPKESIIKQADQEIDYYYTTLLRMGKDLFLEQSDITDYGNLLNQLVHNSVIYNPKEAKFSEENTKFTSKLDSKGKPIKVTENVSRTVYIYSAVLNNEVFEIFQSKYVSRWEKYISSQMLVSGTLGLFSGKKGRLEEKYRSYSFECSEFRLGRLVTPQDKNDSRYYSNLVREQEKCRARLKLRENDFKNLMEAYVQNLSIALILRSSNQVDIWNFEARNLGFVRIIGESSLVISKQREIEENELKAISVADVSCSTDLTPAEMAMMKNKLKTVNVALTEEWAKNKITDTNSNSVEREAKYKKAQDTKRKKDSQDQRINNLKESGSGSLMGLNPTIDGGL